MINSTTAMFERSQFHKSTRSGQNPQACVEVARAQGWVVIRDSKQAWDSAEDHRLVFTAEQFDAWLAAQGAEEAGTLCIDISRRGDDVNELRSTVPQEHNTTLLFTDAEIAAFLDGVRNGEFTANAFIEPAPV